MHVGQSFTLDAKKSMVAPTFVSKGVVMSEVESVALTRHEKEMPLNAPLRNPFNCRAIQPDEVFYGWFTQAFFCALEKKLSRKKPQDLEKNSWF